MIIDVQFVTHRSNEIINIVKTPKEIRTAVQSCCIYIYSLLEICCEILFVIRSKLCKLSRPPVRCTLYGILYKIILFIRLSLDKINFPSFIPFCVCVCVVRNSFLFQQYIFILLLDGKYGIDSYVTLSYVYMNSNSKS